MVCGKATVVVVVAAFLVVVAPAKPLVCLVDGLAVLAITGSAVVMSTRPPARRLSDVINTERRGRRIRCEEPRGPPVFSCPCVILVTEQLSRTQAKVLSTPAQHLLNSLKR